MSKFQKMLKSVATAEKEMVVEKAPQTKAPKKENTLNIKGLESNKEVAAILDMAFMLKSAKKAIGEKLSEKELDMFSAEIHAKAGTVVSDLEAIIPSGFTGSFVQDMFAMTNLEGIFGIEGIANFGMTDTIGDFGMEAYVVSELNTPTDTNDSMIDFEYRGGKLMAKTYLSYEALQDASIDMLANKRAGLMRAMAVALEKGILNGQSGDDGITGADARTLFRGLRKYGLTKEAVDFGGATLTEADFRSKILEMVDAGGLYTSWEEIEAGNVLLFVPTKVYNAIIDFDTFVDASKSGAGSTLASGRRVSSVFGIPVVSSRFFPSAVNASGVIDAVGANNTLQSVVLVNTQTCKLYNINGSALMETDKDIETQKYVMTASNRVGFASIFDQTSAAPTTIDTAKKNIVAGINIAV